VIGQTELQPSRLSPDSFDVAYYKYYICKDICKYGKDACTQCFIDDFVGKPDDRRRVTYARQQRTTDGNINNLGEVDNECTSHNFIVCGYSCENRIIRFGGDLTKF